MWIEHENTQVVQTSWAAMALMYAKYPHTEPIAKAVALVMSRQHPVRDFLSSGHISLIMDFLGRLMGTGSYGRYFQQNLHHFITKLQILVYHMDAWEGTEVSGRPPRPLIVDYQVLACSKTISCMDIRASVPHYLIII